MTVALVTTTINVPTVLERYREELPEDAIFIVAGDLKSPHDEIHQLMKGLPGENRYIDPAWQQDSDSRTARVTPWHSIQRRNVAILEAIRYDVDHVLTIDDDNVPWNDYHEKMMAPFTHGYGEAVVSNTGWWNVGELLSDRVVHRGYPYSQRHNAPDHDFILQDNSPVGVVAGTWTGDPDIDAIERLANRPTVHSCHRVLESGVALYGGTWCPFNSQNTLWRADLAPLMMCWPGVGRFDDIWASYAARAVMDARGDAMVFVEPTVRQERNDHDLLKDLNDELFGYRWTDAICERLRTASRELAADGVGEWPNVIDAWWYTVTACRGLVPELTWDTWQAWYDDVKEAQGLA